MQKRVFLHADVDERRLEIVLKVLNASFEDGADHALLRGMLDLEFLKVAVFKDGNPCFQFLRIDNYLAVHVLVGSCGPLEFEKVFQHLF